MSWGELGIVRNSVARITDQLKIQSASRQVANELHRLHRAFERHLESLQDGLIDVRMVPLRQTFDRLARAIRQLARERDKEVRLVVSGAETEVDKLIVEELTDPLLHLIRNAIDHGVEAGAERKKRGKPPGGTLAINAYHKGNHVVIEVEDDGAGMDPEKILQSAIERGVVNEETADELTTEEIRRLIFVPGMSTAETVTDISGRGVGMDVVKTNITSVGRRHRRAKPARRWHAIHDHITDHPRDCERPDPAGERPHVRAAPNGRPRSALAQQHGPTASRSARGAEPPRNHAPSVPT